MKGKLYEMEKTFILYSKSRKILIAPHYRRSNILFRCFSVNLRINIVLARPTCGDDIVRACGWREYYKSTVERRRIIYGIDNDDIIGLGTETQWQALYNFYNLYTRVRVCLPGNPLART